MAEKLTPRVGDRVIYKDSVAGTRIGTVVEVFADEGRQSVRIRMDERKDHFLNGFWTTQATNVQVVDREPVEWPEGWGKHSNCEAGLYLEDNGWYFNRSELELILATGPDMLARWDELVGEQ